MRTGARTKRSLLAKTARSTSASFLHRSWERAPNGARSLCRGDMLQRAPAVIGFAFGRRLSVLRRVPHRPAAQPAVLRAVEGALLGGERGGHLGAARRAVRECALEVRRWQRERPARGPEMVVVAIDRRRAATHRLDSGEMDLAVVDRGPGVDHEIRPGVAAPRMTSPPKLKTPLS